MPIILMRLTTSRIFGLQKQPGPWPRDVIYYFVKVHGPSLPASQTTSTSFGCRSVMHVRRSHRVVIPSSLANGSTFITTTKSPVMPPSTRFSVQILPPPCPPPRPLLHW